MGWSNCYVLSTNVWKEFKPYSSIKKKTMCSAVATYAYTAKAKWAWKGKKKGTIIVSYFKGSSYVHITMESIYIYILDMMKENPISLMNY